MIAALIIADGKTARGDSFEPEKEVGTIPAIQRIVLVFQRAGIDRVVVVCDDKDDKTEKLASYMNVVFLHGSAQALMLDNVKIGLSWLKEKCEAAIITHANVPLFSVETVKALTAVKGDVCVPFHNGNAGHPIVLRSEHFDMVLSYSGEGGLSGAVKSSGLRRVLVEVDDEGILANVGHDENFERLIDGHSLRESYLDAKLRIVREKPFYGHGVHMLLQLIEEEHSISGACRRMGMSNSKGRNIIANMEQQLGYPVIESRQGTLKGMNPGGFSVVTERGRELMSRYDNLCSEARICLRELYKKHFTD